MDDERSLGRLERVDLRAIWNSEATDFTPWLARPENLSVLGDTIGLDLEVEALEKTSAPSVQTSFAKTFGPEIGYLSKTSWNERITSIWVNCLCTPPA